MKKICLIAGHGLGTPGKRTPDDEREWTFNDKILRACAEHLTKHYTGFTISRIDDPTGKTDIPLSTRVTRTKLQDPDVMVEFHNNALTGVYGAHGGTETFTANGDSPKSEALAKLIHTKVLKALDTKDRGLKKADYYVIKNVNELSKVATCLVEYLFMDSKSDIVKLRNDALLKQAGIVTAQGIAEYLNLPKMAPIQAPIVPVRPKPAPEIKTPLRGVYRIFVNDKQVGAFKDPMEMVESLVLKGEKNIRLERI